MHKCHWIIINRAQKPSCNLFHDFQINWSLCPKDWEQSNLLSFLKILLMVLFSFSSGFYFGMTGVKGEWGFEQGRDEGISQPCNGEKCRPRLTQNSHHQNPQKREEIHYQEHKIPCGWTLTESTDTNYFASVNRKQHTLACIYSTDTHTHSQHNVHLSV